MFLFVDNAHHSVTRFIEKLVFPDGVYEERKSCRENSFYALYTCYAELHPNEESMKSPYVSELVSLVKYWLDRSPLLDFHVNVFLLVKKANRPVMCKSNSVSEKSWWQTCWLFQSIGLLQVKSGICLFCNCNSQRFIHSFKIARKQLGWQYPGPSGKKKQKRKCTKNSVFILEFYLLDSKNWMSIHRCT